LSHTRFFLNCNDGISPEQVKSLKADYGDKILIGFDPGSGDSPSSEVQDSIDTCKSEHVSFMIYWVGPCMMSWSAGEAEQCRQFAESVGIDTKENDWHDKWFDWGWEAKAKQQFEYYDAMGCYCMEIDNLDGPLGDDPDKFIAFYKRFADLLVGFNLKIRLIPKNLSEDTLNKLVEAIESKQLRSDFLAEWGMFEAGTGDPQAQIDICAKIGIQAITPISGITDTNRYGTVSEGVPSLGGSV
jgi:hypothetical protein